MDIQETEFGDPAPSKQKKIIHFSSGETLEVQDSEEEDEEEESSSSPPFREHTERVRNTLIKDAELNSNMVILLNIMSLH